MTSIKQRVSTAIQAFRSGVAPTQPVPRYIRAIPSLYPDMRTEPTWSMGEQAGLDSYIAEGFAGNSLIYSAIMYKARSIATAPLRAYIGDQDSPELAPPDHPLAKLLARPNSYQNPVEFQQLITVLFNLAGSSYILLDRPSKGELPTEMHVLNPASVRVVTSKEKPNTVAGYLYQLPGTPANDAIPILPMDMMAVKLPNPADKLLGMGSGLSALTSLAKSGDVDNSVTSFLRTFFENGAMLAGLIKFKSRLDADTVAQVKERWREQYGGFEHWGDVGVLDSEGEYQRLSPTFTEMGFETLDARNETRILGPFGVPPILIGAKSGLDRATYANYKEAREAFWEDTADPELKLFEAEYDYFLRGADGSFVRHDRSQVPAFRADISALTDAAKKLWDMGVPATTAFKTVGLSVAQFEGDDRSYVTLKGTSQPLPSDNAPDADESQSMMNDETANMPGSGKSLAPEDSKKKDPEQRSGVIWTL